MLNDSPLKPRTFFTCAAEGERDVELVAKVMSAGGAAASLAWHVLASTWYSQTSPGSAKEIAYAMTLRPDFKDVPAVRALVREYFPERDPMLDSAA